MIKIHLWKAEGEDEDGQKGWRYESGQCLWRRERRCEVTVVGQGQLSSGGKS